MSTPQDPAMPGARARHSTGGVPSIHDVSCTDVKQRRWLGARQARQREYDLMSHSSSRPSSRLSMHESRAQSSRKFLHRHYWLPKACADGTCRRNCLQNQWLGRIHKTIPFHRFQSLADLRRESVRRGTQAASAKTVSRPAWSLCIQTRPSAFGVNRPL